MKAVFDPIRNEWIFVNQGGAGGKDITPLAAAEGVVTVPADESKVYTFTPAADDEIVLTAPAAGKVLTVELHLAMPATAVAFSFHDSILWSEGGAFSASASAPDFSAGGVEYALVLRYDGAAWLGDLAYTKEA